MVKVWVGVVVEALLQPCHLTLERHKGQEYYQISKLSIQNTSQLKESLYFLWILVNCKATIHFDQGGNYCIVHSFGINPA